MHQVIKSLKDCEQGSYKLICGAEISMLMYYCFRDNNFGCPEGVCRPVAGQNCANCMMINLQEKGWPLQRYL